MAVRNLTSTITTPGGTALSGIEVEATIRPKPGFNTSTKAELVKATATTDGSGVWTLALLPNAEITPASTWYQITEKLPFMHGGYRTFSVIMPDTNSVLLDVLIDAGDVS